MAGIEECAWLLNGNFCAIAVAINRVGRSNVTRFPNLALEPTTNLCRPAYLQSGDIPRMALLLGDQMANSEADTQTVADFMGSQEIIPILQELLANNK